MKCCKAVYCCHYAFHTFWVLLNILCTLKLHVYSFHTACTVISLLNSHCCQGAQCKQRVLFFDVWRLSLHYRLATGRLMICMRTSQVASHWLSWQSSWQNRNWSVLVLLSVYACIQHYLSLSVCVHVCLCLLNIHVFGYVCDCVYACLCVCRVWVLVFVRVC